MAALHYRSMQRQTFHQVQDDLLNYTVGFVRYRQRDGDTEIIASGSGVFVIITGRRGIITAAHVSDMLRNEQEDAKIGFVLQGSTSSFHLKRDTLVFDYRVKGTIDSEGPDLAFIDLPDDSRIGYIKSRHAFYRMDEERMREFEEGQWPDPQVGLWYVAGYPWQRGLVTERAQGLFPAIYTSRLNWATGPTPSVFERDGFDYCDLQVIFSHVDYSQPELQPESFEGCSGGGLWHAVPGSPTKYLFSGVAFFEGYNDDHSRFLRCHGAQSGWRCLYQTVASG